MNVYQDPAFMKGMSYAGFDLKVFHSKASYESLTRLKKTGINWVAINLAWWQESYRAHNISPHETKTPTDSSLIHLIRTLRDMDIKIMLKPLVDSKDEVWRGMFKPIVYKKWFQQYTRFILHYAALAQEGQVDLLCIGCENVLGGTTGKTLWRKLIPQIRNIYIGPLTYAANFNRNISFQYVPFWDQLDYIGIDAYFPLRSSRSSKHLPTAQELSQSWKPYFRLIENWRRANFPHRDILFTEIGAGSYIKAAETPYAYPSEVAEDWIGQAAYYDACLMACADRPWLKGLFWWWWDNPSTSDYMKGGRQYRTHFTPQGKPAEEVLKKWFLNS